MLTCGPLFRSGCGEVLLGTDFLGLGSVFLGLGAVFHNGIVAGVIRRGSQSALLYIVPGWPISTSNQATVFFPRCRFPPTLFDNVLCVAMERATNIGKALISFRVWPGSSTANFDRYNGT
jgi:hypothetical protein